MDNGIRDGRSIDLQGSTPKAPLAQCKSTLQIKSVVIRMQTCNILNTMSQHCYAATQCLNLLLYCQSILCITYGLPIQSPSDCWSWYLIKSFSGATNMLQLFLFNIFFRQLLDDENFPCGRLLVSLPYYKT